MSPLCGRTLLGIALASTVLWACQFDTRGYTPWDVPGPDAAPLPDALADAGEPNDGGTGCTNGDQRCLGTAVQLCVDGLWTESSVCDWGCNCDDRSPIFLTPEPAGHFPAIKGCADISLLFAAGGGRFRRSRRLPIFDEQVVDACRPAGAEGGIFCRSG